MAINPASFQCAFVFSLVLMPFMSFADGLKVGDSAPAFSADNQNGERFDLNSRKGAGWTVLFFYPKAGTPGCTKEACAFRDSIEKIRALGAEVYGISSDSIEGQKSFHTKHHLTFDLLADPDLEVINKFEAKMPVISIAKRWTFILDPDLKIRSIEKDVDPMLDAGRVAQTIRELQSTAHSS
ncbi:MAG: peroxiredoxin [Bdellovibrionales bacterium]|nr:peroxiredoxin [Bdellovibrionales bacterium]